MWLKDLIMEEINKDQLASTAKSLNIDENELRKWIEETDPTPNKGFSVWITSGMGLERWYCSIRM